MDTLFLSFSSTVGTGVDVASEVDEANEAVGASDTREVVMLLESDVLVACPVNDASEVLELDPASDSRRLSTPMSNRPVDLAGSAHNENRLGV